MKSVRKVHFISLAFAMVMLLLWGLQEEAPRVAAATPVECGATLSTPGEYVLNHDLNCSGTAITISGNDVHLNLAGYTISSNDGAGVGVAVGDVVGPDFFGGTCIPMNGELVELHGNGGVIKGFEIGIFLCHVSGAHVNGLTIKENVVGIKLDVAHFNHINGNNISFNKSYGVQVFSSDGNVFNTNIVNDNYSEGCRSDSLRLYGCGGFYLFDACHGTILSSNIVLRNGDVGIWMLHATFETTVRGNTVMDSNNYGTPTTNIAVTDNSTELVIQGNTTGSTVPDRSADGINIGCKDGCTNLTFGPTTGANNNLIQSNTANDNARYGIAQAAGNTNNTYKGNTATGNGVADFSID